MPYRLEKLKHGTLALVDKNTVVIVISTKNKTLDKNLSAINEIKARKGSIVFISNLDINAVHFKNIDVLYKLPKCKQQYSSFFSIIPLQKLAINICLDKNLSPDKPRNLAKSVTVE